VGYVSLVCNSWRYQFTNSALFLDLWRGICEDRNVAVLFHFVLTTQTRAFTMQVQFGEVFNPSRILSRAPLARALCVLSYWVKWNLFLKNLSR